MELIGKVALVTGSSRGIGRAIAIRLAQQGADIVIDDVAGATGSRGAVSEIERLGRRAIAVEADVSKPEDCARLIGAAMAAFARIDILVNNAGVERRAPFWEVTEQDYDLVLGVNLKGAFFLSQAFVKALRAAAPDAAPHPGTVRGKIINISSVHENLPFPHFTPYCLSKGGMRMLTRTLAVELGPLGVTVNAIAPGAIETPINAGLLADAAKLAALTAAIPLGRLGEPADVAALAAFLAGPASDYMTGGTYLVDGGLSYNYHEQ